MRRRSAEPWYQEAQAAIQAAEAGDDSAETRLRYMPFFYGRWDDAARAHALVGFSERASAVQAGFYAPGAFDPPARARQPPGPGWLRSPHRSWCMRAKSRSAPTAGLAAEAAGLFPAGNARYNLAQVTTRGWMIPPGSLPGCWPSWADPPGPAWVTGHLPRADPDAGGVRRAHRLRRRTTARIDSGPPCGGRV